MSKPESLKYQKLLWSFVLIGSLVLFFSWRIFRNQSDLGFGFDLWVLIMLSVLLTAILTPIIILLRLLRVIINRESFIYILTASINLCAGVAGFWELAGAHLNKGLYILFIAHILNLLFSLFIITDTFVLEVPGIRKTEK